MTLSGNYSQVHLGTAAPAKRSHIHSVGQVTVQAVPPAGHGHGGSFFPFPYPTTHHLPVLVACFRLYLFSAR